VVAPLALQFLRLVFQLLCRRAERGRHVAAGRGAMEEVLASGVQRQVDVGARLLAAYHDLD
jgi:hypothetical protein